MQLVVKHQRTYSEKIADFSRQLGIENIQLTSPDFLGTEHFELDRLLEIRRRIEANGQRLVMIENVPASMSFRFVYGLEGADEQLEHYCESIRNMGKAGIGILGVNFMPNKVWRTRWDAPARGGATASAYDEQEAGKPNQDIHCQKTAPAGIRVDKKTTEAEMWTNFERYLEKVLPVAQESGVRLALHPDDPPVPCVDGVARIFHSAENLLKGVEMADSSFFGLNLCLGAVGEMQNTRAQMEKLIDVLVPQNKVFTVHFRGVHGTVPSFQECFLDECDIDPAFMMQKLYQAGYHGFVMDDHYPHMIGDDEFGLQARAFSIGYIKGLIAMIRSVKE